MLLDFKISTDQYSSFYKYIKLMKDQWKIVGWFGLSTIVLGGIVILHEIELGSGRTDKRRTKARNVRRGA